MNRQLAVIGLAALAMGGCLEIPPFPAHLFGDADTDDADGTDVEETEGLETDGSGDADGADDVDSSLEDTGPITCTADPECDDKNACNGIETCGDDGVCEEGVPITCPTSDAPCGAFECVPSTGACSHQDFRDGESCNSENPCLNAGVCNDGACTENLPWDTLCSAANGHAVNFCRWGQCLPRKVVFGGQNICVLVHGEVRCAGTVYSQNASGGFDPSTSGAYHGLGTVKAIPTLEVAEPILAPGLNEVRDIGNGPSTQICAANYTGQTRCWGSNNKNGLGVGWNEDCFGELGDPLEPTAQLTFQDQILGDDEPISAQCGLNWGFDGGRFVGSPIFGALQMSDGSVRYWGTHYQSWLGLADGSEPDPQTTPLTELDPIIPSGTTDSITTVTFGAFSGHALTASGDVFAWGKPFKGIVDGDEYETIRSDRPLKLNLGDVPATYLAQNLIGGACAVLSSIPQSFLCWGLALEYGGYPPGTAGTTTNESITSAPTLEWTGWSVTTLVSTGPGYCALDDKEIVHCWGSLEWLFSTQFSATPQETTPPSEAIIMDFKAPVAALFGGFGMICGILTDGRVQCIGASIDDSEHTLLPTAPMTLP